jgi:hypothetical protein
VSSDPHLAVVSTPSGDESCYTERQTPPDTAGRETDCHTDASDPHYRIRFDHLLGQYDLTTFRYAQL